jgi:hypothetical protein
LDLGLLPSGLTASLVEFSRGRFLPGDGPPVDVEALLKLRDPDESGLGIPSTLNIWRKAI